MFLNICSTNEVSNFVYTCSKARYSLQAETFFKDRQLPEEFLPRSSITWYHLSVVFTSRTIRK